MSLEPFIQKLTLHNFRSIRDETVLFANPLFLVGRNSSGKSNFVDALVFLADCMINPLQSVIEQWGGLGRVGHLHTPTESPYISFRLDFQLNTKQQGTYAFTLKIIKRRNFIVFSENCRLNDTDGNSTWFNRSEELFTTNVSGMQLALNPQALAMPIMGGTQDLAPVYQALAAMRLYRIKPEQVGGIQGETSTTNLKFDGSNITSVLLHLSELKKGHFARVRQLLQSIVPGVSPVPPSFSHGQSTLFFEQVWPDMPAVLEGSAMSSGTLSALAIVSAALQEPAPSLIAIEEPELNIHPGALEAIADIINIAAQRTQVVITTHSSDLLDAKWIAPENIRVVEWAGGATHISDLGEAPVKVLQQHLMGAGELLRANALDAAAPSMFASEDDFAMLEKHPV